VAARVAADMAADMARPAGLTPAGRAVTLTVTLTR